MARFLSQTLTLSRTSSSTCINDLLFSSSNSRWMLKSMCPGIVSSTTHRHGSNQSGKAHLIEVDLDSSSSSTNNDDVEVLGIKKLDDVIHSIIVKRSAPDWLPFLPGSSYWVPPRPIRREGGGIIDLLGRLANPLPTEESLSLSTVRGWPSSSFFIPRGTSSTLGVPVEVKEYEMPEKDSDDVPPSVEEE